MNTFRRVFDFLAGMGLIVRDDPPKVVDLTGREWGAVREGFALSISRPLKQDPEAPPAISVVLRNVGESARELTIPGWFFFYRLRIASKDGVPVEPSPFGRELLKPERDTERRNLKLAPGEAVETEVPIGSIYSLRGRGEYSVQAGCLIPDGPELESNRIAV